MSDYWDTYGRSVLMSAAIGVVSLVFVVVIADAARQIGPGVVAFLACGVLVTAFTAALPFVWRRRWERLRAVVGDADPILKAQLSRHS